MKRRVSKNAISLARTLGVAGLLAVALVMTPGCSQADDHQTTVQVANSDNAQEEGAVYGKFAGKRLFARACAGRRMRRCVDFRTQ